ncbi:hypothetical protein JAB4_059630 (plasmid) [Janthinobacterium sp. HH102]|nr:hypothetical protein JAB4_059630 [Janthinobacterium sp. HH102]
MEKNSDTSRQGSEQTKGRKTWVCRRLVLSGKIVATLHPVIGPLYWEYFDNSDCNAPDSYGITEHIESAHIFKSGSYRSSFDSFLSNIFSDAYADIYTDEWNDESGEPEGNHLLTSLAEKAGSTPSEFMQWIVDATWVEYPAPPKVYFLADFNGHLGYRAEWSEQVSDALHWDQTVFESDDLDEQLARTLGELVPIECAEEIPTIRRELSSVNHPLMADVAYTMHRLDLVGLGVDKWSVNYKEIACTHAARAGIDYVRSGDYGPISPHIVGFPMLLNVFNMAASLKRYEVNKNNLM